MSFIKSLYKKIFIGDIKNTEVEPDVDEWYRFLASLPEPKDCFEAAYNKYLCRKTYVPKWKTEVLDRVAYFVLKKSEKLLKAEHAPLPEKKENTLFLEVHGDVGYQDVMPPDLFAPYDRVDEELMASAGYGRISKEAYELFLELQKRYPREHYFQLFVLKELANHSYYLAKYNPAATAVYINERNIATPILKKLYVDSGRSFISFMHGEYLLQMIQAYMSFTDFYVWDEQYVPMFRDDLHCGIDNYHVITPKKLTKKWHLEEVEPTVYCTYYFSGESTASVKMLAQVYKKMAEDGKKVLVRPHPRYSHLELIDKEFPAEMIENPKEITMEQSLARTQYVIGLHTTVLSEAIVEGRTAVIDDISDPKQFANLKKRKFVVLGREHRLFSEII